MLDAAKKAVELASDVGSTESPESEGAGSAGTESGKP
jgi:hypothetical protein